MTDPHTDQPAAAPEQSGPGGLVRLRIEVAYDGTDFHGWARQPGLRSVQAELEAALRTVLRIAAGTPVRVAVAGRTDSGVHAAGQVCHCDIPAEAWARPARGVRGARPSAAGSGLDEGGDPAPAGAALGRRLNGLLPPDLRVARVAVAPRGFDARWSAAWRRYTYLVADDPAHQDPRSRGCVLWHPRPLDVPAMAAAAAPFVGEHDFAAFCRPRAGASTVRTIHEIGWVRLGGGAGRGSVAGAPGPGVPAGVPAGTAIFMIRADAFCHSMVRSLVGAFLAVGEGRWDVSRPAELLAAGVRVPAIPTAPAHGLTLVEVGYPAEADLAVQAERAKRWRGPQPSNTRHGA